VAFIFPWAAAPTGDGNSSLDCFAVRDKVRTDAANLLLEHSFDLSDLFLNFAGVFFGVAFGL
jgi:hypothetical protein